MPHKLINPNPDLRQLWDEGYEIEIVDAFLMIHHIPYLANELTVKYGTLVSTLDLAGDLTVRPGTHVTTFIGETPHHRDGRAINAIIIGTAPQKLHDKITINLTFSSKPDVGYYDDYFQKMVTYINILSSEAKAIDPWANEKTYKVIETEDEYSVFNYYDTNSSRAEISPISDKLKNLKVVIIGGGGTGAYILDFIAKTPVVQIDIYDSDVFLQHNAFRAPGAPSIAQLRERLPKVEYLAGIYRNMHSNIVPHAYSITEENVGELTGKSFVFISIDDSKAKEPIIDFLESNQIPFIDVGIGVQIVRDQLIGVVRTTTSTENKRDHVRTNNRISFVDDNNNDYAKNIQIAELNAINASFAIIKWKKIFGVYHDAEKENHTTYTINESQLLNEDHEA
ncbi:ThiF family protein [Mucilaginibacter pineti]|uniref:ThiF family protein n=1 Tax=Mucilaginibacter pineti TaxID=1391627 RepID=A0A1G7L4B9_9SPHI|nr:ThiF family adenylyltransferase [Mucilaginibacter pineti]SDF44305.1 ThiF family protein [Mucilaginibacter pineti]